MSTRTEADRAIVRTKLPRDTVEGWNDKLNTAIWCYDIDNELGVTFRFASFFDGALYRTALLEPAELKDELIRRGGAHKPHIFSNGYICLGEPPGTQTLDECWAKTAIWAYHVAANVKTGEWLFLNR